MEKLGHTFIQNAGKIETGMTTSGRMAGKSRTPPKLVTGIPVDTDNKISKVPVQWRKPDGFTQLSTIFGFIHHIRILGETRRYPVAAMAAQAVTA